MRKAYNDIAEYYLNRMDAGEHLAFMISCFDRKNNQDWKNCAVWTTKNAREKIREILETGAYIDGEDEYYIEELEDEEERERKREMYNTIRLLEGEEHLTRKEYEHFRKGDTVCGPDSDAKTLQTWPREEEEKALAELEKYRCTYDTAPNSTDVYITEYALEYCLLDEEGEFLRGSDFTFAEDSTES